ncbi:MAG: flagellar basal body P-ring protein FlgI [Methylobacteriaceae bacterium]|nr:flagellar basal body P-ring protein FlgI [Rhodoblastus sp.]MCC0004802.1 flagellar basal body P-ring protein FlgI [Methylobacteriaceae bacterium]
MLSRLFLIILCLVCGEASGKVRLKDITAVRGPRESRVVGYGLVVGLQGTGDSLRNSVFTEQSLQSMLDRMGIAVKSGAMRTRNVAAVIVSGDIPSYARIGTRLDVTVSSMGDATSLVGGTLIMTPLVGPDGIVYASAQGPLSVTGFAEAGRSESVAQGVPTTGRIANGGVVERDAAPVGPDDEHILLELRNADFKTAVKIADAINLYAKRRYSIRVARERDSRSIELIRPPNTPPSRLIADIGDLLIEPDIPARVVIDARSGTVVVGADVQVSTVAVTHGALSVRITETPNVSQPNPRSQGQTVVTSETAVSIGQDGGQFAVLSGASLKSLIRGLNQIGLKPAGIISILQAIKSAGALQADIVVQ